MVKNGGFCTKCRNRLYPEDELCYKCGNRPQQHLHQPRYNGAERWWQQTRSRWQAHHYWYPHWDPNPQINHQYTHNFGKGKGNARTTKQVAPPPRVAPSNGESRLTVEPPPGIVNPREETEHGIPGNPVIIDKASEIELIDMLRWQERKLGSHDPSVIHTRERLATMQKARHDSMSLEQQAQSLSDRIKHKLKALQEAEDKVKTAQEAVDTAAVNLAIANEAVDTIQAELSNTKIEQSKVLGQMQANAGGDATNPLLNVAGIVLPPDVTTDVKEFAEQVNQAMQKLQQLIVAGPKVAQTQSTATPANQEGTTQTAAASSQSPADQEMNDKKGVKERRTVSLSDMEDSTPASKRAKAVVVEDSQGEATAVVQCS